MPHTLNVGSRSYFVTATAWVVIVLALLAGAAALVERAELASLLPGWRQAGLPAVTGLLLQYLPWVMAVVGVLSVLLVACSVGLLLRLEWARRVFIVALGVVIAANLLGLWLQHEVVQVLVHNALTRSGLPAAAVYLFGGFAAATQVMAVVVTLLGCGLLAWVIRGLMSEPVRQEFA
jgi:hypothetical protein